VAIDPGPHDLDEMRFILGPTGKGITKVASPTFYEELDQEFQDFRGHLLIQRYTFHEPWPTWEVHPEGDEFVYLLEGDTEFLLRRNGVESSVRVSEPGSYVVVPQGAWHTARPYTTTTMLFVTPGEGTLNELEPPPDA
jgi:mannose-6-phosphate isomerase-like protein (cupin superfamily)